MRSIMPLRCHAVLLTLTTTVRPATDLGYLLHKHPDRVQRFAVPFGAARVFYPEASEERCTAALLLEVDPVGLVRRGGSAFALAQYVNDRPYVASSFLSVALNHVYKSALEGRCSERDAGAEIPLVAELPVVPGGALAKRLFEPLGYEVHAEPLEHGGYVALRLSATSRLADLLRHLYVLLPVLDDEKHYWIDESEIEKLLKRGEGWLPTHPERELITRRYLKHQHRLYHSVLATFEADDDPREEALEERVSLRDQRLGSVQAVLKASGAKRVLDLGCGSGALLQRLVRDGYDELVGVDVSARALEMADQRLKGQVKLIQSPLTYRDKRLAGYDAAALVEVIEHFDPPRLEAAELNVFGSARPGTVVVTTPNAEYNRMWETLPAGQFRHSDHRFEWTRAQFAEWAAGVGERHGYRVRHLPIGPEDAEAGPPTQMAVFER
jgi:3' terminal RNA ribose 2'-O-methyltransferase Hen1